MVVDTSGLGGGRSNDGFVPGRNKKIPRNWRSVRQWNAQDSTLRSRRVHGVIRLKRGTLDGADLNGAAPRSFRAMSCRKVAHFALQASFKPIPIRTVSVGAVAVSRPIRLPQGDLKSHAKK